jgi:hypothetical protein
MSEHLEMYLEGFRKGDAEMILRALADDFVYDDPVDGRFTKAEFAAYLGELLAGDEGSSGAARRRSSGEARLLPPSGVAVMDAG